MNALRVYAVMEHDEDGDPTGRIEVRSVIEARGAQATGVVGVLDVQGAAHLIGDLAESIENVQRLARAGKS
jgi:hypothetical protein